MQSFSHCTLSNTALHRRICAHTKPHTSLPATGEGCAPLQRCQRARSLCSPRFVQAVCFDGIHVQMCLCLSCVVQARWSERSDCERVWTNTSIHTCTCLHTHMHTRMRAHWQCTKHTTHTATKHVREIIFQICRKERKKEWMIMLSAAGIHCMRKSAECDCSLAVAKWRAEKEGNFLIII